MTDLPAHVALLAPVPLEHLLSGAMTCAEEGKVAFGSRAFEAFAKLRDLADGAACEVLIYASDAHAAGPPKVTWKATYLGFVEAKVGRHPAGMKFRPKSTEEYSGDNHGHWYIFWEVANLQRLDPSDQIEVKKLKSVDNKAKFSSSFIPHGPLVIDTPF